MKRRVSKTAASPAAKKSKNEQPDLTSFFASPGGNKQHSNAPISSTSNVISLLSDDESDTGITQPKPKASTSKSKSGSETTSAGGRPTHQRHTQQNAALVLGANEAGTTTLHPLNYPIERDLFEFDPALHIDTTSWPTSADGTTLVPYAFLASAFAKISATKSRLAITNLMANCLRTIICYQPAALLPAIYLVSFAFF